MECICKNCVFYEDGRGLCRRWPPVPQGMLGTESSKTKGQWPEVAPEDWCGEYREQTGEHKPFEAEM